MRFKQFLPLFSNFDLDIRILHWNKIREATPLRRRAAAWYARKLLTSLFEVLLLAHRVTDTR